MARNGRGKEMNAAKAIEENARDMAKKAQDQSLVLISSSTLKQLLKDDDHYKEEVDGLVGELRETIKNAVDKKHLNKDAYALLKKFHRIKSNEKLRATYVTFLAYLDMAGVMKRIDSVQDLPLDGEKEQAEEEGSKASEKSAPEKTAAEVVKPQFGGRASTAH